MNAAPERPLTITVKRSAGRCQARAATQMAGASAELHWIYVRFVWPMGADYILLHGQRPSDGTKVEEKL